MLLSSRSRRSIIQSNATTSGPDVGGGFPIALYKVVWPAGWTERARIVFNVQFLVDY